MNKSAAYKEPDVKKYNGNKGRKNNHAGLEKTLIKEAPYLDEGNGSNDPLNLYLKEIRLIPNLTEKEEKELGRRIKEGDHKALERLVEGGLKFVVAVACEYKGRGLPLPDLINEGNIGLIIATMKYNPDKNNRFLTYAGYWVKRVIQLALAEQSRIVNIPEHQIEVYYHINATKKELRQKLSREPNYGDIAKKLETTPENVELVVRAWKSYVSLTKPVYKDGLTTHLDMLPGNFSNNGETVEMSELRKGIERILKKLTDKERTVIESRYGLYPESYGDKQTLEKIGKELGITRQAVEQIQKGAQKKLEMLAKDEDLGSFLY